VVGCRPACQLAAVLPGEVEQHGEHLRGQFDRDPIDPVEHLTPRQIVEALGGALADIDCELVEVGWREHRGDGSALRAMARLVHGDEAFAAQIGRHVADRDAAERGRRREHRMIVFDVHDVVVPGHRPIRTEHAVLAVVHGRFLAQPVEIRPEGIGPEQFGVAGIELVERDRIGSLARRLLLGVLGEFDGPVHAFLPVLYPRG
jgi:hypothetical protein